MIGSIPTNPEEALLAGLLAGLRQRMTHPTSERDAVDAVATVLGKALQVAVDASPGETREHWKQVAEESATTLVRFIRRHAPWTVEEPPLLELREGDRCSYPFVLGMYF